LTKDPKKIGVIQFGWDVVQNLKTEKMADPEESLATLMFSANEFSDAYIASELIDHCAFDINSPGLISDRGQ